MKVGDMVGYVNGDGPTGIVLDTWADASTWSMVDTWCEILWDSGEIGEVAASRLEKIQ
jgi:hypothetical protein